MLVCVLNNENPKRGQTKCEFPPPSYKWLYFQITCDVLKISCKKHKTTTLLYLKLEIDEYVETEYGWVWMLIQECTRFLSPSRQTKLDIEI